MNNPASLNQTLSRRNQFRFPHNLIDLLHISSAHTLRLAIAVAAAAWLPAIALSTLHGLVSLKSFLLDIAAQSRLLIVLPLLVLTEPVLTTRLATIARHFLAADLVRQEDTSRFEKAFAAFERRGNSLIAQVGIVVIVYVVIASSMLYLVNGILPRWCYMTDAKSSLSGAGTWYVLVSIPIMLYLLFRWMWRQILWSWFLQIVSRMDLKLVPSHPDLVGGLGFLESSLRGSMPFSFALGTIVAGAVANEMIHSHLPLLQFKHVPIVVTAIVVILCVGPLCAFMGILLQTKRRGTFEYGSLAIALGHQFESKWLNTTRKVDGDVLEVPDFSATTDLYSVAANVRQMNFAPFSISSVVRLIGVTLIPAIPVALIAVPFDVLLQHVIKLLL